MSSFEIVELLKQAQVLAEAHYGIKNILRTGIVREMIMAEMLGHSLVSQIYGADAQDLDGNLYEYLTSLRRLAGKNKGCSFGLNAISQYNLERITRNKAFYFGVFDNPFEVVEIWKVKTSVVLSEAKRQLRNSIEK